MPLMPRDVEFLECRECGTPCYVFEIDAKGNVSNAYCNACGADEPTDFAIPDEAGEDD